MSSELFKQGGSYTFETYAGPILGAVHERVIYEGFVSYKIALSMGYQVGTLYRNVYPSLPAGTPDIPELEKYHIFMSPTGSRFPLCDQWIKKDTVKEVALVNFSVVFERADVSLIDTVSKLLSGAGITDFQVNVKT